MASHKTIINEGCELSYWHQGKGPLLILIPGGGGCGRTYFPILSHISHKYTVCTLDRRQSGQSTLLNDNVPRTMNPSQQIRDIIAVMKDLGFSKTSLFGNSGGGILALHFAAIRPEYLEAVVCHEAPTSVLLPDFEAIQDKLFAMHHKSQTEGPAAAFKEFRAMQKGFENFPTRVTGSPSDVENFLKREFLGFAIFCPDLRRVVRNGVNVAVGAGRLSADAFYARTTVEQGEILGCEWVEFPGNHAGFELEPEAFAEKLLPVLEKLEKK